MLPMLRPWSGSLAIRRTADQGVVVAPINASRQQPVLYVKMRHAFHSLRNVHQCSDRALF